MVITAAMVQFMLDQAGHGTVLKGDPDRSVARVGLLRPGRRRGDVLYVAEGAEQRALRGCTLIAPAPGSKDDAVALLEAASDAVMRLRGWDGALKDALLDAVPLGDYVKLAEQVLPYTFGFYDENVSVLGASSNFSQWMSSFGIPEDAGSGAPEGAFPPSMLADLFEDEDYQNASLHTRPFYYSTSLSGGSPTQSYCVNLFDGGDYIARLVVMVPPGEDRLPRGAEALVDCFFGYLGRCFVRFTGSDSTFGNQHDPLHALFSGMLFDQEQPAAGALEGALSSCGWARASRFVTVKFVFFEAVRWESAALFICQQLERRVRCSCAMPSGRSIAWVVNLELLGGDEGTALLSDAVLETIRTYACKAGISDPFGDFAHVLSSYRECEAALATGQATDPHLWYYRFGDMGLDYIMCKATEDFPAELLASKKLLALVRADEDGQGEYVKTLRCYLDNRQSATRTAEELFMHRTSLLRRLERIVRISGIDFDDADEVLYLALSLRMLDRA